MYKVKALGIDECALQLGSAMPQASPQTFSVPRRLCAPAQRSCTGAGKGHGDCVWPPKPGRAHQDFALVRLRHQPLLLRRLQLVKQQQLGQALLRHAALSAVSSQVETLKRLPRGLAASAATHISRHSKFLCLEMRRLKVVPPHPAQDSLMCREAALQVVAEHGNLNSRCAVRGAHTPSSLLLAHAHLYERPVLLRRLDRVGGQLGQLALAVALCDALPTRQRPRPTHKAPCIAPGARGGNVPHCWLALRPSRRAPRAAQPPCSARGG